MNPKYDRYRRLDFLAIIKDVMKFYISQCLPAIVAVTAVGLTMPAFAATTGQNSGHIRNSYVTSTTQIPQSPGDFLITITGLDTLCPGHGVAYVNQTDSNYLSIVGTLQQNRGQGRAVIISWTTDASGYCHMTSAAPLP